MPKNAKLALAILSFSGYLMLSFLVERHQHFSLLTIYGILFFVYLLQLRKLSSYSTAEIFNLAILIRVIFLISFPTLSDDFYRFIWDGRLLAAGFNPFEHLPGDYLDMNVAHNISSDLYYKLNSPEYYTVYPPLVQFIFLTAASLFPDDIYGSMVVMKCFAFMAEIGVLILLMRMLMKLGLSRRYVAIYALNPLVIIEIMGNLHHEGMMLFLFLLALYLIHKQKFVPGGIIWAMAVATKLLPLIYLPLLLRRISRTQLLRFALLFIMTLVILFSPLIEGVIAGMFSSISLYFQKFEFNASLYYIFRKIGFLVKGYNTINIIGPILGIVVFILIFLYSLKKGKEYSIYKAVSWILVIYLIFSTTIHPWYVIPLIGFSVLSGYFFPLLWSFFIFLTYSGYSLSGYEELWYVIVVEYVVVFSAMLYEIYFDKSQPFLYRFSVVQSRKTL